MHTSTQHAPPPRGVTIAIDGPAGSGKSTVSRRLAEELEGGILDTGAMYRALAWHCLEHGIDLADREAVALAAQEEQLRRCGCRHNRSVTFVHGAFAETGTPYAYR